MHRHRRLQLHVKPLPVARGGLHAFRRPADRRDARR
jgi:hypothetical protein